jgi:5-methylcytosine-specific restriction endonuclease McrA
VYCDQCRQSGEAERHRNNARYASGEKPPTKEYNRAYRAKEREARIAAGWVPMHKQKAEAAARREARRVADPKVQVGHYRKHGESPSTVDGARAILKHTLITLLQLKCDEAGLLRGTVEYAAKYRTNPAFRAKQKAKTAGQKKKRGVLVSPDGSLTPEVVRRLFATTSMCPYCDRLMRSDDKSLDHMHPVSLGGLHTLGNVTVCCKSCNARKRAAPFAAWMQRMPPHIASRFEVHRAA